MPSFFKPFTIFSLSISLCLAFTPSATYADEEPIDWVEIAIAAYETAKETYKYRKDRRHCQHLCNGLTCKSAKIASMCKSEGSSCTEKKEFKLPDESVIELRIRYGERGDKRYTIQNCVTSHFNSLKTEGKKIDPSKIAIYNLTDHTEALNLLKEAQAISQEDPQMYEKLGEIKAKLADIQNRTKDAQYVTVKTEKKVVLSPKEFDKEINTLTKEIETQGIETPSQTNEPASPAIPSAMRYYPTPEHVIPRD